MAQRIADGRLAGRSAYLVSVREQYLDIHVRVYLSTHDGHFVFATFDYGVNDFPSDIYDN